MLTSESMRRHLNKWISKISLSLSLSANSAYKVLFTLIKKGDVAINRPLLILALDPKLG